MRSTMSERTGETKMIGFNAPLEMIETLDKISMKRWGKINRTDLLYEAVTEYIKLHENTDYIDRIIRQRIDANPTIVEEAIQNYTARKLRK